MNDTILETRTMPTHWRYALWGAAAALLALPAVAMQFTSEVNWGAEDFFVMAVLLGALCLGIEQVVTRSASTKTRIGVAAGLVGLFVIIWMELAVGIFGSPLAGS